MPKNFAVFDTSKGFFHVPLDNESKLLTVMLTLFGIYVWHQADHPAVRVVPALGFAAFLGHFMLMRFRHAVSKAHHLF